MSAENSIEDSKESKAYQRLVKNLTIDLLWIWVLKLLREGPKYAYQLKQEIQATLPSMQDWARLGSGGLPT